MSQLLIMYWSILHMVLLHYKAQSVTAVQEFKAFFLRVRKAISKTYCRLNSLSVCLSFLME